MAQVGGAVPGRGPDSAVALAVGEQAVRVVEDVEVVVAVERSAGSSDARTAGGVAAGTPRTDTRLASGLVSSASRT